MVSQREPFPQPPGQSTIRVIDDCGTQIVTNAPSATTQREKLEALGSAGEFVVKALPVVARTGSCFSVLWMTAGYVFLIFGVLFIGGMFIATVFLNQPFQINGQPAGKADAMIFLGGFLAFWVLFCSSWIWGSRRMLFNPDKLDQLWRLSLNQEEWISNRSNGQHVIGRCVPEDIERVVISPAGRVVAQLLSGSVISLTGPLVPFDGAWLREALTASLGREIERAPPVHPCVPLAKPAPIPGSTLAHRLSQTDSRWKSVLLLLGLNLFWNGITSVFLQEALWGNAGIQWGLMLFLIPFELIGLALLAGLAFNLYRACVELRIGPTVVELSIFPLCAGKRIEAFIVQEGPLVCRQLCVRLVCDEEATYRAGTSTSTDSKRVRDVELFSWNDSDEKSLMPIESRFAWAVPDDAMHSFEGTHNKVRWTMIVQGTFPGMAGLRGRFPTVVERKFPVVVHPSIE